MQQSMILIVKSGPNEGMTHVISAGESIRIGRTVASNIYFECDNFMSSVHFEIHNLGDAIEVRDLRSTNKTWVNNVAISKAILQPGDTVRAGKTTFAWQWEQTEQPVMVAPNPAPVQKTQEIERSGSPLDSSIKIERPNVLPLPVAKSDERSLSPIDSLGSSFLGVDGSSSKDSSVIASHSSFGAPIHQNGAQRLIRLNLSNVDDFAIKATWVLEQLRSTSRIFVVAHFKKIGMLSPHELNGYSIFEEMDRCRDHLPLAIEQSNWDRWHRADLINRLAANDGLLFSIVNKDCNASVLQRLSKFGIAGMSESGGFLGWCWPSQWESICARLSETEILELMGDAVHGMLVPLQKSTCLRAYVRPGLCPSFENLGFVQAH